MGLIIEEYKFVTRRGRKPFLNTLRSDDEKGLLCVRVQDKFDKNFDPKKMNELNMYYIHEKRGSVRKAYVLFLKHDTIYETSFWFLQDKVSPHNRESFANLGKIYEYMQESNIPVHEWINESDDWFEFILL